MQFNRIFFSAIISLLICSCHFQNKEADLIVHNARIYTVDEEFSVKEAMAIKDGRIIAIGPEREIMNEYNAPEILDAEKKCIYPGFIDAHCHFMAYGLMLQDADLTGAKSFEEVLSIMKSHADKSDRQWLIGRGWDQNDWKDAYAKAKGFVGNTDTLLVPFPDKSQLDALFPDRPVMLTRIDGHAVLVNQAALDLAGVSANSTIEGGLVELKEGKPTGILIDRASLFVDKVIPERTFGDKIKGLSLAENNCFSVGLTTVDEAGLMKADIDLIDSLQRADALHMRVYAMISDDPRNYDYYLQHGIDTASDYLTVRSFKFYADGALGSRGACLLSPYEDILQQFRRRDYGMMLREPSHFRQHAWELYSKGFQMNTHAIGDSANRVMLGIYKEVLGGVNDRRWRIEHAQVVDQNDINSFSQASIIPSVQPTHATSDMPWAWQRLGRNRVARAYVYKDLLEQLGLLALGTDFPVEGISPFNTFVSAVFRQDSSGQLEGGFQMENAISREAALRGMTIWAAIANFEEHKKGSLEVGKLADFIVVDTDLMKADRNQVQQARVHYTYVGGIKRYTIDQYP